MPALLRSAGGYRSPPSETNHTPVLPPKLPFRPGCPLDVRGRPNVSHGQATLPPVGYHGEEDPKLPMPREGPAESPTSRVEEFLSSHPRLVEGLFRKTDAARWKLTHA